jgi:hypothetical protein
MKLVRESLNKFLNEEIYASEAYDDRGAIQTVVVGKRNVGLVNIFQDDIERLKKQGIKMIHLFPMNSELRKEYHDVMKNYWGSNSLRDIEDSAYIIYRKEGEKEAKELYNYMLTHRGFVSDSSPEEAKRIGKLLGYNDKSIEEYIERRYKKIAESLDQRKDAEKRATLVTEVIPEFVKTAEKHIEKDLENHTLNKKLLNTIKDSGGKDVKIYAVNGDFIRDGKPGLNFNGFVDGGHYYVTSLPGYKQNIPEDEIWVDDVFEFKPNDLRALILHEFVERNLMKYKKWTYDNAHEYANMKETEYRKRVKK